MCLSGIPSWCDGLQIKKYVRIGLARASGSQKLIIYIIQGSSEKSDEFKSCIFRVVLGIECRMGYQVKACSKIFCLSENPLHGVTY